MIYLSHKPAPPLHLAVEAIWLYSGYQPPHRLERILPSGTIEWVINLREKRFRCYDPKTFQTMADHPGAIIAGPRSRVQIIDTEQQTEIMGVHLRPGGQRLLTGIPAHEFAERDVPLENLWGSRADDFRQQLIAAPTPREKLLSLERLLAERLCLDRRPHRAVPEALRRLEPSDTPLRQADLAAELGLSSRRFIEVFTACVGLTPKVYARIRRFQKALISIHGTASFDWARLALDCGWCDQAHMIRDFKQFSGLTPAQYGRLQGEFMLHVPIEERGQICPIPASELVSECPR
jgi:AraC-like DNA-binding protein